MPKDYEFRVTWWEEERAIDRRRVVFFLLAVAGLVVGLWVGSGFLDGGLQLAARGLAVLLALWWVREVWVEWEA